MKKSEFKALVREVLQENHYAMQHPEEFDSGVAPYSQCGVRDGSNARSKPVGYKGPQEKLSLADGSDLLKLVRVRCPEWRKVINSGGVDEDDLNVLLKYAFDLGSEWQSRQH